MLIFLFQDSSGCFSCQFSAGNEKQFSYALRRSIIKYRSEFYKRHFKASQFVLDRLGDLNDAYQHSVARKRLQADAIRRGYKFLDDTLTLEIHIKDEVYVVVPDDVACKITEEEAILLWPGLVSMRMIAFEYEFS